MLFSKHKVQLSLANQIKKVIGMRILICSVLIIFLVGVLTFYDIYTSINQLQSKISQELKPLEDFTIGQMIINNPQAIEVKLNALNRINHAFHVEWESVAPLQKESSITLVFPFSWDYDYKLGEIAGYQFGYFKVTGSLLDNKALMYELLARVFLLIVFLASILIFLRPVSRKIPQQLFIEPINRFIDLMSNPATEQKEAQKALPKELESLENKILELLKQTKEHEKINYLINLGEIAAQVAHDIRSPLTALNVTLKNLPQIPEEQRIILRNAANRINDIANNLLIQYKNKESEKSIGTLQAWLMTPIIENMLSEKRLSFQDRAIHVEAKITNDAYFIFAKIDLNEIKRVLSNLINNASEAFSNEGTIVLFLRCDEKNIYIDIIDNGCGIPAEKLPSIFEAKTSTKEGGSGIGLAHAKEAIEKMGGQISISSKVNEGTTVSMIIPRVPAPDWFASNIMMEKNFQIVVLDDDESIHGAWDTRLKEIFPEANTLHFRKGQDFIDWHKSHENTPMLVLSDYELLGELKTGLDILEKLKIGHHGILITSHYEKPEIIERCVAANIRLLPKNLVPYIPIELKIEETSKKECDYVLIDDDKLITDMWLMQALTFNKKLVVFNSIAEAEKSILTCDKNVTIYIDSNLEEGKKGEDYAKKLYDEYGFHTIYLATGHSPSRFKPMYWIKAIVGKDNLF